MGGVSSKHPDIHVVVVSPSEGGNYDTQYFQKIITEAKQEKEPVVSNRRSTHQHTTANELQTETIDSRQGLPSSRNLESQLSSASSTDTLGAGRSISTTSSFYAGSVQGHQSKNMLRSSSFVKPTAGSKKSSLVSRSYVDPKRGRDGEVKMGGLENETEGEGSAAVEQPSGNMFELFQTGDGREFTVYVREDGKKFYVDWEEQKWRHFPPEWETRGQFVPMDSGQPSSSNAPMTPAADPGYAQMIDFQHPTRGKLYMWFQKEQCNVLYFYHDKTGSWVPVPLVWESQVPSIAKLTKDVQTIVPSWTDKLSIVATLRQCKYNVDDAVSTYLTVKDEDGLDGFAQTPSTSQNIYLEQLKRELTKSNLAMNECKARNKELHLHIEELQMRIEELENELDEQSLLQASAASELHNLFPPARHRREASNCLAQYAQSVCILAQSCRSLKAKLLASRNTLLKMVDSFRCKMAELDKAVRKMSERCKCLEEELTETKVLYRKEFHQRKQLHNELLELKGNIRVFCRCRPDNSEEHVVSFLDEATLSCPTLQGKEKRFEFDKVFNSSATQEEVFAEIRPVITSSVDGYNVCIIAYGQTSSGKTYTMMGPSNCIGVNLRSLKELFSVCAQRENIDYTMRVSMVEIYNETISDLLISPGESRHHKLHIQKQGRDVCIPGLTEIEVLSMADIEKVIAKGDRHRSVANTVMNTNSSRSHLLLMLSVEGHDKVSGTVTEGRLTLVDLAGSERISRTEAKGIRLVEAAAINKSLSALGQVFAALRNNALHIPYRNSKLTHLLSSSLGGEAKACMFVAISPLKSNHGETLSSLDFGQNVKQVELGKATKRIRKPPPLPS